MQPQSPADFLNSTQPGDLATRLFEFLLGDFFSHPFASLSGSPSLVGALFMVFNSAVFMIGMIWAGYGLLSGVAETADKGEVLGRKQSTVWLPIRMVTGVAGIVPVFSGFSLAQVLIVSMASLGIGIGNMMWSGAVSKAQEFTTIVPPSAAAAVTGSVSFKDLSRALFITHMCRRAHQEFEQMLAGAAPVADGDKIRASAAPAAIASVRWGTQDEPAKCGGASLVNTYESGRSNSSAFGFRVASVRYDDYAEAVRQSYKAAFPAFDAQVAKIADTWWTARLAANQTPGAAMVTWPNEELVAAAHQYAMSLQAVSETLAGKDLSGLNSEVVSRMKEGGWLQAGAWYSTFAEASAALADAMRTVRFDVIKPQSSRMTSVVRESFESAVASLQTGAAQGAERSDADEGDIGAVTDLMSDRIWGEFTSGASAPTGIETQSGNLSFGQLMVKKAIDGAAVGSGGGGGEGAFLAQLGVRAVVNPIIMFKNLGDYAMTGGQIMWALGTTVISAAGSDDGASSGPGLVARGATAAAGHVPGPAGVAAKLASGAMQAVAKLGPLLTSIGLVMLVLGGLMAIYIPMIPFITWMGGLIQYTVVVCEGLAGAPIAALSHLDAEGEGLGRRTEAGYMFVLNVLFRPALMLFGFFMASALMIVLGTIQVSLFLGAMANAQGNSITGVASFVGYLMLFFVLNVTLIQGLFNMIFLMADKVLNMIGSHGATNELGHQVESKMHGLFVSYGRQVDSLGHQAMRGSIAAADAKQRQRGRGAGQGDGRQPGPGARK